MVREGETTTSESAVAVVPLNESLSAPFTRQRIVVDCPVRIFAGTALSSEMVVGLSAVVSEQEVMIKQTRMIEKQADSLAGVTKPTLVLLIRQMPSRRYAYHFIPHHRHRLTPVSQLFTTKKARLRYENWPIIFITAQAGIASRLLAGEELAPDYVCIF